MVRELALASDPRSPVAVEDALRAGRVLAVMELLGTPEGLDIRAIDGVTILELGDTAAIGAALVIDLPRVHALDPALPVPEIRARAIRIAPGGGATELVSSGEAQITIPLAAAGAYRVELTIVPRHLGPYLGDLGPDLAEVELPWIYASPIYVE